MLLVVLFFAVALAAPLDLPLDLGFNLDTFRNVTATNRCSDSPDWQAYAFLVEDCFTAIQRVYIDEVLKKPDEVFEFISKGAQRKTKHPWVRTPLQFTVSE